MRTVGRVRAWGGQVEVEGGEREADMRGAGNRCSLLGEASFAGGQVVEGPTVLLTSSPHTSPLPSPSTITSPPPRPQGYQLRLFLESFGIRSALLNAELPLNSRSHILQTFNKGLFDYLIATGVWWEGRTQSRE